jgi:hypothetical protein
MGTNAAPNATPADFSASRREASWERDEKQKIQSETVQKSINATQTDKSSKAAGIARRLGAFIKGRRFGRRLNAFEVQYEENRKDPPCRINPT